MTQTLNKAVRGDGKEDVLEAVSVCSWYFPTFGVTVNLDIVEYCTKDPSPDNSSVARKHSGSIFVAVLDDSLVIVLVSVLKL